MERIIRTRKEVPEIGWGDCQLLETAETAIVAMLYEWRGGRVLTLHNMSNQPVVLSCPKEVDPATARPLLRSSIDVDHSKDTPEIRLGAYGFEWLRLA